MAAAGRSRGVDSRSGAGASSGRAFVNSILVAIDVLHGYLQDLHLSWSQELRLPHHCSRSLFRAFCEHVRTCKGMSELMSIMELGPQMSWQELRNHQLPTHRREHQLHPPTPLLISRHQADPRNNPHNPSYTLTTRHHEPPSASLGPCMLPRISQTLSMLTRTSPEMMSTARTTPHTSRPLAPTSTPRAPLSPVPQCSRRSSRTAWSSQRTTWV